MRSAAQIPDDSEMTVSSSAMQTGDRSSQRTVVKVSPGLPLVDITVACKHLFS